MREKNIENMLQNMCFIGSENQNNSHSIHSPDSFCLKKRAESMNRYYYMLQANPHVHSTFNIV